MENRNNESKKNNYIEKEKAGKGAIFEPTGEVIKDGFNRKWGGHRFTDEEVEQLLSGNEIKIRTKNDNEIIGRLEKRIYKKKRFWGFQIGIPEKTAGHLWSEDERQLLYNGEELIIDDFYSLKKEEYFSATAFWDDAEKELILDFNSGRDRFEDDDVEESESEEIL